MHRTTMMMDDGLYRMARKTAFDQNRTFKDVMHEALQQYLVHRGRLSLRKSRDPMPGVYRATVKGTLSRREIYEDRGLAR